MEMIKITVPATSANFGPGFDCLGVAVNLYNTFYFSDNNQGKLSIEGCPVEFQNENNLVYRAFKIGCDYLGKPVPNVQIKIENGIPISRGLGSSASCIVAGIQAADWFQSEISKDKLLALSMNLEPHPDNLAPAIYGKLCSTHQIEQGDSKVIQHAISEKFKFTVIIPDYQVSTAKARQILPDSLRYSDITLQLSRVILLMQSLSSGNLVDLDEGLKDLLHEPYRSKLIPDYKDVKNLISRYGSSMYISGSGSTMISITDNDINRDKIINELSSIYPDWHIKPISINNTGVKSEVVENK
ncbi:homoserine kinase [Apilactobacillus ozensis DSM 23829 = JCM 17196]|uniref:Homoserine kinase n=3 Tax=Apilactobacillus ozensis TaxID=866801 RepID=A0A0R2AUC5_9LACO|nr:homoserine kinase [Apilactobacillus ozensis DSM 23829 = JCM 17196]